MIVCLYNFFFRYRVQYVYLWYTMVYVLTYVFAYCQCTQWQACERCANCDTFRGMHATAVIACSNTRVFSILIVVFKLANKVKYIKVVC